MPSVYQELAAQIVRAQRDASTRGAPQIIHTTIEGAVPVRDASGQLTAEVGEQWDGTYGVYPLTGPPPPKPVGLTFKPVPGGGLLTWQGLWEDVVLDPEQAPTPQVAPMDFKLVEFHASTDPAFSALFFDTKKSELLNARGGEVLVSLERDADYYFRVVARSHAGTVGAPSDVIGPFRAGKAVESDLDIDWTAKTGTRIYFGADDPRSQQGITPAYGDLWLQDVTPDGETTKQFVTQRWVPGPDRWEPAQDQGISDALAQALQAAEAAATAQASAEAAANQAAGKTTTLRQPDQPPTDGRTLGDEWIDTDAGNRRHIWDTQGVARRDNLLTDPALRDTVAWDAVRASLAIDVTTTPRRAGGAVLRVTVTSTGTSPYFQYLLTAPEYRPKVTVGQAYTASFYVQGDPTGGQQARADLNWYDADGLLMVSTNGAYVPTPNGAWTRITTTGTAPAGAVTVRATATMQDQAVGRYFTVTDGLLETGAAVGGYFDGDSGGEAIWNGTDANRATASTWEPMQLGAPQWVPVLLRSSAFEPKSLVARDVVATGTVTAALLEAILVLATTIIAGPPTGTHTEITPEGVFIYADDPVDGTPNLVLKLGTRDNDYFGLIDANGLLVASIDANGAAHFTGLSVDDDPIFQGLPLSQRFDEAMAGRLLGYYRGKLAADITPVDGEIGIVEVNAFLESGRSYFIKAHFSWSQKIPETEATFRFRSTRTSTDGGDDAPAPVVGTSTSEEIWWRSHRAEKRDFTEDFELLYNASRNGRHRFMLTAQVNKSAPGIAGVQCNGSIPITPVANAPSAVHINFPWTYDAPPMVWVTANSAVPGTQVQEVTAANVTTTGCDLYIYRTTATQTTLFWRAEGEAFNAQRLTIDNALLTTMSIVDAGPTPVTVGQQTAGGGTIGSGGSQPSSPTTTKQQYYKELAPAGKASWRGDGSLRTDLGSLEVVQGPDPTGYNGIGKGMYWFNLPSITGTVDRVDVYLYASHWYENGGGEVAMNISDQRGSDPNFFKLKPDWYGLHLSKPGGRWITLPSDWWALFKGTNNNAFNGRAMAITAGPPSNNLHYYGRLTNCKLRLWYTQ